MIDELKLACQVCEGGAALERYRHLIFDDAQVRAFNGVVSFQAPSDLDATEQFAVNEERLARALSACEGENLAVRSQKEFLVFRRDKLTIRVRKIAISEGVFTPRLSLPRKEARIDAAGLLEALRAVAPFMSADASRPWSVSVLVRDGFAWATNNLSLVRAPVAVPIALKIPAPALTMLTELPGIDWIAHEENTIFVGCKRVALCFPESAGDWPDLAKFFAKAPKKLPALDEEMLTAAKTVEKFADRFVTLNDKSVEGKTATLESEYEVEVRKGIGTYSARLLSLILTHATHADFSTYPEPVFFGREGLEGCAVGVRPEMAKP